VVQKKAAVCGEERCVTSLKTAAKETILFAVRSNSFAVTVVGHCTFEILSTKILDFFNMCVFVRTSTNFAQSFG